MPQTTQPTESTKRTRERQRHTHTDTQTMRSDKNLCSNDFIHRIMP